MEYTAVHPKVDAVPVVLVGEDGKPTGERWYMVTGYPGEMFEAVYAPTAPVTVETPPKTRRKPGPKPKAGLATAPKRRGRPPKAQAPATSMAKGGPVPAAAVETSPATKPRTNRDAVRQAVLQGPKTLDQIGAYLDEAWGLDIPRAVLSTMCGQLREAGEFDRTGDVFSAAATKAA